MMGFGSHRKMHHKRLFGISDDKPVVITVVDEEQRLRSIVPELRAMVKEGLMVLVDAEVIPEHITAKATMAAAMASRGLIWPAVPPPARTTDKDSVFIRCWLRFRTGFLAPGLPPRAEQFPGPDAGGHLFAGQ